MLVLGGRIRPHQLGDLLPVLPVFAEQGSLGDPALGDLLGHRLLLAGLALFAGLARGLLHLGPLPVLLAALPLAGQLVLTPLGFVQTIQPVLDRAAQQLLGDLGHVPLDGLVADVDALSPQRLGYLPAGHKPLPAQGLDTLAAGGGRESVAD